MFGALRFDGLRTQLREALDELTRLHGLGSEIEALAARLGDEAPAEGEGEDSGAEGGADGGTEGAGGDGDDEGGEGAGDDA